MKFLRVLSMVLLSSYSFTLHAEGAQIAVPDAAKAYRQSMQISIPTIVVPTVVQVPFPDLYLERNDVAVFDLTSQKFEPDLFLENTRELSNPLQIESSASMEQNMLDGNTATYGEFTLPDDARGSARIVLSSTKPLTSSALTFLLDTYVALPTSIEIRIQENGGEKIVVAKREMRDQTIHFPKTTASTWIVSLTYGQPLRITELRLSEENVLQKNVRSVRFLAQPSHNYRVYFDPDRVTSIPVGEASNLSDDKGVLVLPAQLLQANPTYTVADTDGDSVPDLRDNCVQTLNTDQLDVDQNGRGDACDDFDKDGLINSIDNCVSSPNRNQVDTDGDAIGDACDTEESRITERSPWLPWAGMGFAAIVLVFLMVSMLKSKPQGQ